MAITLIQSPQAFTPSDNQVVWTFSSNQTAQPNFIFVIKIYINDALIGNEVVFPNGIYGKYDGSHHTSNYCDLPTISGNLAEDAANYCRIRITIVERYGSPAADATTLSTSNVYAWKSKLFDSDFINFAASDYIYSSGGRWLTNHPNYPSVRLTNESVRLSVINNGDDLEDFKVELFDSAGASIVSDTTTILADGAIIMILNLSPSVIVASALAITDGDFADCAYFEVSADGGSGMIIQRINIDNSVVYSTYKRIHSVGQFGNVEAFSFGLITRPTADIKSMSYERGFGGWNGGNWSFDLTAGINLDYGKAVDRGLKCTSDWLTDTLHNWLIYNLIASPVIYIEQDNELYRVAMKAQTIDEKIQENDMLFMLEISIVMPMYKSMTV